MMCALDAILASVARGGKVVSIVPVDGEDRAALESELAGVCDQQSPVSRNGDQRFIGVDPDGAEWTVALLAVPWKPCSQSRETLQQEYQECFARPLWPSLEAQTAAEMAHRNLLDWYIENPSL